MLKGRLEDDRMLTGRGKYVSDWNLPGQAYGHFVRSDRAHAEIVSIGKEQTLAHPGVIAVFTGEDIEAALKSLPCALPVKGRGNDLSAASDRKSTRLNSSHTVISYAVFCLKKKNNEAPHRVAGHT